MKTSAIMNYTGHDLHVFNPAFLKEDRNAHYQNSFVLMDDDLRDKALIATIKRSGYPVYAHQRYQNGKTTITHPTGIPVSEKQMPSNIYLDPLDFGNMEDSIVVVSHPYYSAAKLVNLAPALVERLYVVDGVVTRKGKTIGCIGLRRCFSFQLPSVLLEASYSALLPTISLELSVHHWCRMRHLLDINEQSALNQVIVILEERKGQEDYES